jgi:hypothetical protein
MNAAEWKRYLPDRILDNVISLQKFNPVGIKWPVLFDKLTELGAMEFAEAGVEGHMPCEYPLGDSFVYDKEMQIDPQSRRTYYSQTTPIYLLNAIEAFEALSINEIYKSGKMPVYLALQYAGQLQMQYDISAKPRYKDQNAKNAPEPSKPSIEEAFQAARFDISLLEDMRREDFGDVLYDFRSAFEQIYSGIPAKNIRMHSVSEWFYNPGNPYIHIFPELVNRRNFSILKSIFGRFYSV